MAKDDQKVVSKEVIERISDGENYDDVVAELKQQTTLLENLSSDKDAQAQKEELEAQILERQKELEAKEQEIASRDEVIADNEQVIAQAQEETQAGKAKRGDRKKGKSCFKAMPLRKKNWNYWPKIWRKPKTNRRN